MSRSGYSDDGENLELWRGSVARAIGGKRGQAFLHDMIDALDALPEKKLIADILIEDGAVCALGSVGLKRGIAMDALDPHDHDKLGAVFGIARVLVAEIEFLNDEGAYHIDTPEKRWQRMRDWAVASLKPAAVAPLSTPE